MLPLCPPRRGYVVRDTNGQALAYVYGRADETIAMQAKVLTDDEVRAGRHQYCAAAGVVGALVTSR